MFIAKSLDITSRDFLLIHKLLANNQLTEYLIVTIKMINFT